MMKYVIVHGDGMADWACPELGGKTPLQAARKPNMDRLAACGELGTGRDDSSWDAAGQRRRHYDDAWLRPPPLSYRTCAD